MQASNSSHASNFLNPTTHKKYLAYLLLEIQIALTRQPFRIRLTIVRTFFLQWPILSPPNTFDFFRRSPCIVECFQYGPWVQSALWCQFRTASPVLFSDDGTKISFTVTSSRNTMCKQKAALLHGWLYEWDELKKNHKAKHLCSVIGILSKIVTTGTPVNLVTIQTVVRLVTKVFISYRYYICLPLYVFITASTDDGLIGRNIWRMTVKTGLF
jgi:hypothetical protein